MTVIVYLKSGKLETYEEIQSIDWGEQRITFSCHRWVGIDAELEDFQIPKDSVAKVEIVP